MARVQVDLVVEWNNNITYYGETLPVQQALTTAYPYVDIVWEVLGETTHYWEKGRPDLSDLVNFTAHRMYYIHTTTPCTWSYDDGNVSPDPNIAVNITLVGHAPVVPGPNQQFTVTIHFFASGAFYGYVGVQILEPPNDIAYTYHKESGWQNFIYGPNTISLDMLTTNVGTNGENIIYVYVYGYRPTSGDMVKLSSFQTPVTLQGFGVVNPNPTPTPTSPTPKPDPTPGPVKTIPPGTDTTTSMVAAMMPLMMVMMLMQMMQGMNTEG